MRGVRRAVLAGVTAAVALAAATLTVSPAHADYEYTVKIDHSGWFVADFCLHSESYNEANRDHRSNCTGAKGVGNYEISVKTTEGHRVWLDVWVRGGTSAPQVTMHNGYQARVNDHVFYTRECEIPQYGTTFDWWLSCRRDGKDWQEYWHS